MRTALANLFAGDGKLLQKCQQNNLDNVPPSLTSEGVVTDSRAMKTKQILAATLALALLPAMRSNAALITWATPTLISGDTDVSTTGSLLYAFTFGDTGVASATVNGVTFAPFAAPTNSFAPATVGNVTLDHTGADSFFSTNAAGGINIAPYSNLSTAYKGMLQSLASSNNETNMTLTLGGLTNGTSYQVECWANVSGTFFFPTSNNTKTILTAGNPVTLDANSTDTDGGVGQWVTGTFTATGTTQLITVASDAPGPAAGAKLPILNGLEVRTVPEPASAALLGLGAVLLANRRRRSA